MREISWAVDMFKHDNETITKPNQMENRKAWSRCEASYTPLFISLIIQVDLSLDKYNKNDRSNNNNKF